MRMKKVDYEEPLDSYRVEGNLYCIADEMIEEGVERTKGYPYSSCGSSDAMSHYVSEYEGGVETSSAYCFSCAQSFTQSHMAKSSLADELGIDNEGNVIKEKRVFERKPKQPRITKEQIQEVISYGYECTLKHGPNRGKPIRGILEEYNKFFGHITKKDKNGNPMVRFYPETNGGNMYGYKTRTFPKNFGYENKGITGIKNDLSGQIKFKDMQFRDIVITAGEEDKVAFFQQFDLYQKKRTKQSGGEYAPMPVVSPNTGEKSAVTQIRDQYDFVNRAERIFIGMDNDEVGRQAAKDIADIFPSSKIYIISWSYKDPNNAINNVEGKDYSAQTIRDFYNAKPLDSCGFVGSGELDSMIEKELLVPKIPLPHFMKDLQKMMAGGIPLGYIINIIGETGGGKCLGFDTPIRMADSTVKMVQDVVVGDLLMGGDGSPRKVKTLARGEEQMYRIEQNKGITYDVNESHILSLRASFDCKKSGFLKGDVVNISVKDWLQLGNKAKKSLKGYKGTLTKLGMESEEVFDPYMIGLWLADGTTTKPQFTFWKEDKELLEEFSAFAIRNGYTITSHLPSDKETVVEPYLKGGFKTLLRGLDLIGHKHIPLKYKTASLEERLQLLAGLLDGDGYKTHSNCFEIAFKSNELASDVEFLARSVGLYVNVSDTFKKCQNFEGGWYKRMYISVNTEVVPNRLSRKKCSTRRQIKDVLNTGITVTPLEVDNYYGFEIDGDKLFCLEDMTVTHNTSFVNEMLYDWIFNSPHKMGVISLELTAAQYGIAILSRHIGKKLNLFELGQDAVDYINTPEILEKRKQLWKTDEGEDRWTLLDEREGSLVEIQKQAELLYRRFGCKLLVLDPLQDILDGSSNEEQSLFMKWEKKMVKLGVTIININHTRKGTGKNSDGTLRDLLEDDIHGSSAIAKSGGANIFLMRDKYGETDIEKNTTYIKAGKIRWTGKSGWAGKWYYDLDSHTIYDFKEYFKENPEKLPSGFDTETTPFDKKDTKGFKQTNSKPTEPESVKKVVPELKIEKIELPNMEK